MSDKKHSKVGVAVAVIISAALLTFAGWLVLNKQYVSDLISAWSFEETPAIKTIEDRIKFTDEGRLYFRTTQPKLSNAAEFNKGCPRQEPGSPILGCYNDGRIYIFNITNQQLDGMEEVTAAHEMLHAVWERMSPNDQKRIGQLLRSEYGKLQDDSLKQRMDYYARTEPGEFENELHSILGTEKRNLSKDLESYYTRYFEDRSAVVDLHDTYNQVFIDLSNKADSLFEQLQTLGSSISKRSIQYNQDVTQLSSDIQSFNTRANNGDFASISQFNSERAALVARSNQLDADRESINNDIVTYNRLYDEYQVVGAQIESLNKSIDSIESLQPAPSL